MAFSHDLRHSILINAPPAFVRQTMLDFPNFPAWSHKYITNIEPAEPHASAATVNPGVASKLSVNMSTMARMDPQIVPVVTNTEEEFAWSGRLPFPFALQARHSFAFKPAGPDGRSTEFVQSEHFSGFLTGIVGLGSFFPALDQGFKDFNAELKARCEATYLSSTP